jgi:hypothetical protein
MVTVDAVDADADSDADADEARTVLALPIKQRKVLRQSLHKCV